MEYDGNILVTTVMTFYFLKLFKYIKVMGKGTLKYTSNELTHFVEGNSTVK